MTREEIFKNYDVDENGIISSPGKFEGEMFYVLHFYQMVMDGGSDGVIYDELTDRPIDVFLVNDDDRLEFPELMDCKTVALEETDQGFIICHHDTYDLDD